MTLATIGEETAQRYAVILKMNGVKDQESLLEKIKALVEEDSKGMIDSEQVLRRMRLVLVDLLDSFMYSPEELAKILDFALVGVFKT